MYVASQIPSGGRGTGTARPVDTGPDGSFAMAVRPQPGHLAIQASSDDYVFQAASQGLLFQGRPGVGRRIYTHAILACDPKPDRPGLEVSVALRRGATVRGRVVGPDDRPVREAWLISRLILRPGTVPWRLWSPEEHGTSRDGRFELHGLDPDTEVPVYFLDPNDKRGATVRLSGKSAAKGPVAVRLEPCGAAKGRLVGPDGAPLAGFAQPWLISMVVTPDAPDGTMTDADFLTRIDPIHYLRSPMADTQGRIVFPALIPRATYRIVNRGPRAPRGTRVNRDFTAKPGEILELGDILVEKPQAQ
jgi:hypothetical protein